MKNKLTVLFALFLFVCFAACSCGSEVSALENFCVAVRDFDLAKAEKYVLSGDKYFENVKSLSEELTDEQRQTVKDIYKNMAFSDFKEEGGVCTFTVKYVDFDRIIREVETSLNMGASADESLREIAASETFQKRFMQTKTGVKVQLEKDGGNVYVSLGISGENAEFTSLMGLDKFLRWYSLQS